MCIRDRYQRRVRGSFEAVGKSGSTMLLRLCLFLAFIALSQQAGTLLTPASCRNNVCPLWDYKNTSNWAQLCPDFATCAGGRQSPIDISGVAKSGQPAPLNALYAPFRVTLFNTGNRLLLPVPEYTGVLTFNNVVYSFTHVYFHTPSEHTINGTKFDLEIQLVHESVEGHEAVISLLYTVGVSNPILDTFWSDLPQHTNCSCGNGRFEPWMGEACDEGSRNSDTLPNACRTNCKWFSCGDSVIDAGEGCDNGPRNSNTLPNSCRVGCLLPRCGDGVVDSNYGEQCDDGNNFNGDGCTATCFKENLCGNGVLDAGEQCDAGLLNSDTARDACRTNCTLAYCGDGVVDTNETCDWNVPYPSYSLQARLCRRDCSVPTCGDGVWDELLGEECDEVSARCDEFCKLVCGNGRLDGNEQCDNGIKNSNIVPNACRTNCRTAICGDGVTDAGEQCDNGGLNGLLGGRCSRNCTISCGNGRIDAGEQCDNGLNNNDTIPDACREDCTLPRCGDGVADRLRGEVCDGGVNSEFCVNCSYPVCGDGVVSPSYDEQCDDGNTVDGDGCSSFCQSECGNGVFDGFEECDNGAFNSNSAPDACRLNCKRSTCGDGVIDSFEECDNGARNSNTSNQCRTNCRVPYCGDGILDTLHGEVCDNGALNSDWVVDGCSTSCIPNQCRQSVSNAHVDFSKLFPPQCDAGYYTYVGSHTKPPCYEPVQWIVFDQVGYLSPSQLSFIKSVIGPNSRPTQPLGKRLINYPTTNGQRCGNGIREGTEECDDPKGNSNDQPNRCRKNCKLPSCGDGVVDCGEECDGGPVCTSSCTIGTGASTNKTVVNMFFKDLIPYNYFCCNAARPDSSQNPCPRCYQQ
eukprot:TRINITY_DN2268_c0_g1_i1.p1 TRINITY_DN2268_c0_g1~~TRINITY_DN2268_c0_g1_i1.p1  ORF type:complete len:857 (-),score=254.91 TRINITY_DN2268_c0_g1_i1:197-2767(-)